MIISGLSTADSKLPKGVNNPNGIEERNASLPREIAPERGVILPVAGAALARLSSVPVQQAFLDQVVIPLLGTKALNNDDVVIAFTEESGNPVLSVKSKATLKLQEGGRAIRFNYRFVFQEGSQIKTPKIGVIEDENNYTVILPAPNPVTHEYTEYQIKILQDAWRRCTYFNPKLHEWYVAEEFRPTGYQRRAVSSALHDLSNHGTALTVMATGTGKSPTATLVIDKELDLRKEEGQKPVALVLVNNTTVLTQLEGGLKRVTGEKYEGKTGQIYEGKNNFTDPNIEIIYATPGSLEYNDYEKLNLLIETLQSQGRQLSIVCHDETHHLPAPNNTKLDNTIMAKGKELGWKIERLGFTATPVRYDSKPVLEFFDGKISSRYLIGDALQEGYLTPFQFCAGDLDINPGNVSPIPHGSEIDDKYRKERYDFERRKKHIFTRFLEHRKQFLDPVSLIIAPDIASAKLLAAYFRSPDKEGDLKGVTEDAVVLTGADKGTQWYEDVYFAYKNGYWRDGSTKPVPRTVIAVDLFNEGVDIPRVNVLMLWAYSESGTVLTQWIGRGLRICPFTNSVIIDDLSGALRNIQIVRFLAPNVLRPIPIVCKGGEDELVGKGVEDDTQGDFVDEATSNGDCIVPDVPEDFVEEDIGHGECTHVISENFVREAAGLGVYFDESLEKVVQDFAYDLPANLCYVWKNFFNCPDEDREKLERFIAIKTGLATSEDPSAVARHKLRQYLRTVIEATTQDSTKIRDIRDKLRPAFFSSCVYEEDDYKRNQKDEIPFADTTDMVYRSIEHLMNDIARTEFSMGDGIPDKLMFQLFFEFSPTRRELIYRRGKNLSLLRTLVFGEPSRKKMTQRLIDDLLGKTILPTSEEGSLLSSEGIDLSRDTDSTVLLNDAERVTVKKPNSEDASNSRAVVGYSSSKPLQDLFIRIYGVHPKLTEKGFETSKIEELEPEQFTDYLFGKGLVSVDLQSSVGTVNDRFKTTVRKYCEALQVNESGQIEDCGTTLIKTFSEYVHFFAPERLTNPKIKFLHELALQIRDAHREYERQHRTLPPIAAEVEKVLDLTLQNASLLYRAGEGDNEVDLVRNSAKDFTLRVKSLGIEQKIEIRSIQYPRPFAVFSGEVNQRVYTRLGDARKLEIIGNAVEVLQHLIDTLPEVVCFIPIDSNEFNKDLIKSLLENSNCNLIAAPSRSLYNSELATQFSRLNFLSLSEISPYGTLYGGKKGEDLAGHVLVVYDFKEIYGKQLEIAERKINNYKPTPETQRAYAYLKVGLNKLKAGSVEHYFKSSDDLSNILFFLEANNKDTPLNDNHIFLAAAVCTNSHFVGGEVKQDFQVKNQFTALLSQYKRLKERYKRATGNELPRDISDPIEQLVKDLLVNFLSGEVVGFNNKYVEPLLQGNEALKQAIRDLTETTTASDSTKPEGKITDPWFDQDGKLQFWITRQDEDKIKPVIGKGSTKKVRVHGNPHCPKVEGNKNAIPASKDELRDSLGVMEGKNHDGCKLCKPELDRNYWSGLEKRHQSGEFKENVFTGSTQ